MTRRSVLPSAAPAEAIGLAVFRSVLAWLKASRLLRGKTLGIDSKTLEVNAAMKLIVVLREAG